nr:hypothetical protein [Tanacetum cinerariifolium]
MIYHYKLALAQVESRLVEYKEREVKYIKKIRTLEFYSESNKSCIESLKKNLETLKQEKEVVDVTLAGLLTASKNLDNLIKSQRSDKSKEGLGYTDVPPPPAQLYLSPKKDLSWTGLPECADDTVTDYSRPLPTVESSSEEDQNRNPSVSENVASPITTKPFVKFVKASDSQSKSPDFVMKKKACFNCGDFNHLAYECRKRVKRGTTRSQNNTSKSSSHRPVVHRPHGSLMRPMRSNMNCACSNRTSFNKPAHSYKNRPFQRKSAVRSQYRAPWVPTVNRNFPPVSRKFSTGSRNFPTANRKIFTASRKFPTASRKFPTGSKKSPTADMGMKGKAATYPTYLIMNHLMEDMCLLGKEDARLPEKELSKLGSSQNKIDDKGYWDSGCSRHMIGNISYLSDYEPFDGGYVSFGQGGCKITKKGTIKTGKLEFENVYIVKDLKHNLVRGLPTKCFKNDHNCTACLKGKQHKASCLHGLFLKSKDETSDILKKFITKIENLKDLKVKIIRCDNGGEFRNKEMNDFCSQKGIKREFSNARTPQRNVVDAGTNSTNFSGTKDGAGQEVKKDVSTLRYIALPNWAHDAFLESSSSKSQDDYNTDVSESSRNLNPTATSTNSPTDHMETLTVETLIPTVIPPVPTACFTDSQEPSSETRLISKRVTNQEETPSLDNILTLSNQFEDILGVTTNLEESNGAKADSLVDCPKGVRPIGTKWVLKNKKDERGIVIRNKARLVAQGHIQEEGINHDEVFAPVARNEAIRLFLAYASFMGFTVYHMDIKSAFLYDTINEEVGTIDHTLFIRRQRGDFILVQVYVDDIIFGSSNSQLRRDFEALMHEKFQMSAIGELNFFLGLQVLQKEDGIFLSQDKYVGDILNKFGYSDVRSSNTPMDKENLWGKDGTGKHVDLHHYRSMIGSLMYLTASRPNIMFAVCACTRHQVIPKECHLHAVKRIFRYLKGHPKLGLWYPKDSHFDLVAYLDSDYGGATQDRKSTTGGCQFLGRRLISW